MRRKKLAFYFYHKRSFAFCYVQGKVVNYPYIDHIKHSDSSRENVEAGQGKSFQQSTIWDVRINHLEQMVTSILRCGMAM